MVGTIILISVFVGLCGVVWAALQGHAAEQKMLELMRPESSFERVVPFPFDQAQLERLRGRVDRVGALKMDEVVYRGNNSREVTMFHVFLIDEFGEVRDVLRTEDQEHASKTAYGLANVWSIPLEDRDRVLDDRFDIDGL